MEWICGLPTVVGVLISLVMAVSALGLTGLLIWGACEILDRLPEWIPITLRVIQIVCIVVLVTWAIYSMVCP